jgi:hypothetical protein
MEAATERLDTALRRTGLYVEHRYYLDHEGGRYLIVDAILGDVAFSDRIQKPEAASDKRAVKEMDIEMRRTDFADTKAELRRRIAEGKPLMGDDKS